jgi:hypothetical protein
MEGLDLPLIDLLKMHASGRGSALASRRIVGH